MTVTYKRNRIFEELYKPFIEKLMSDEYWIHVDCSEFQGLSEYECLKLLHDKMTEKFPKEMTLIAKQVEEEDKE